MATRSSRSVHSITSSSRRLIACGLLLLAGALAVRLSLTPRTGAGGAPMDIASVQRRAAASPSDLEAQIALGDALVKANRLHDAEQVFDRANALSTVDARAVTWLAMLAVQRHDVERAAGYFREAIRRSPGDADLYRSLAELYDRQGKPAQSVVAYERATALRADDEVAWRLLGLADIRIGRFARGREALLRALALVTMDMKARAALADVDLRMGLLQEAGENFRLVIAQSPDDPAALVGSAQVTTQLDPTPSGLALAERQVDRALALHPVPQCYLVRGHIALLRQKYGSAIQDLNRALAGDPSLAEALGYLSQAYAATGRPADARRAGDAYQAAEARRKRSDSGTAK
jgi:predicted Zn-dependent protease